MAFSLRRGKAAVLKAAALVVLILLVIVAALIAWVIRSPFPKSTAGRACRVSARL